jgi:hypothetical protein
MNHPSLRPVPQVLYPTLGSLKEVLELAQSQLPITNKNEVTALLLTYHNTLLRQISKPS